MATSILPNVKVTSPKAGTFDIVLKCKTGDLITEKVVPIVFNPDPTPPEEEGLFPPETTYSAVTVLPMARPPYLIPVEEKSYGVLPDGVKRMITRISDRMVFGDAIIRQNYSKDQSWNCDNTRMVLCLKLLDATGETTGKKYSVIRSLTSIGVNPRWSRTDPDKMFTVNNLKAVSITPSTNVKTTLRDFTEDGCTSVQLGPGEGCLDETDTYAALSVIQDGVKKLFIYNIVTDTITTTKTWAELGITALDYVSMTPSGQVVIRAGSPTVLKLYSNTLTFIRNLPAGSHPDYGYNLASEESVAMVDPVSYAKLSDGVRTTVIDNTVLKPINGGTAGGHCSMQATDREGYAYVSLRAGTGEIFSFKMGGDNAIERWCFHRGQAIGYDDEAKACPRRDGKAVRFTSKWQGQSDIDVYVVELVKPA